MLAGVAVSPPLPTSELTARLLALDAQDFHALIERVPDLAAHVHRTAKARLADTAQAQKGDLAAGEPDVLPVARCEHSCRTQAWKAP